MLAYSWGVEIPRILHNSFAITWGFGDHDSSDITTLLINQIYTTGTLHNINYESRGWCHVYILHYYVCTALHNCSSLDSLVFPADVE